jgi:hypothetical protein
MTSEIDAAEIAKAWSLRCISIVNASTVVDLEEDHNYRHHAPAALRAFARAWTTRPYPNPVVFGRHTCSAGCPMFEYVPPGKCSGDIFVCWASGDIHVCTKELCRHTEPQYGFPGYNNARRAVCHVCILTRRVFSVNHDQTIGGGGGGDDDDEECGAGSWDAQGGSGFGGDGGRALLEYESDAASTASAAVIGTACKKMSAKMQAAAAAAAATVPLTAAEDAAADNGPSSKRKRATAASAAVPRKQRALLASAVVATPSTRKHRKDGRTSKQALAPRLILYGDDRESRERRIKIYAGVVWKHLPDAETGHVSAWVHVMERIWSVMQTSPGFKPNNSQLQPRLFALVCLNYMRDIGLTTKTLCGTRAVRVLPANAYIRAHMADIKQIGEHGFTQAERALMCCMNELSTDEKLRLEFDDKAFPSFYSFYTRLCQ